MLYEEVARAVIRGWMMRWLTEAGIDSTELDNAVGRYKAWKMGWDDERKKAPTDIINRKIYTVGRSLRPVTRTRLAWTEGQACAVTVGDLLRAQT
jgi:hypothetical protein